MKEKQDIIYNIVDSFIANLKRNPSKEEIFELINQSIQASSPINCNCDETSFITVPIIGKVAAGSPIFTEEHFEKKITIDPSFFDFTPDYFLRVSGCSMINAGILDGDLIAVRKVVANNVRNGEIVIARVNHSDVTVKRYQREGNTVWLMPENDEMSPIKVDLSNDNLEIDGVYVGLMRN